MTMQIPPNIQRNFSSAEGKNTTTWYQMFFSDKGSNYRKLLFKVTSATDATPKQLPALLQNKLIKLDFHYNVVLSSHQEVKKTKTQILYICINIYKKQRKQLLGFIFRTRMPSQSFFIESNHNLRTLHICLFCQHQIRLVGIFPLHKKH